MPPAKRRTARKTAAKKTTARNRPSVVLRRSDGGTEAGQASYCEEGSGEAGPGEASDGQEVDCEAGPGEASDHEEGSGEEGTREASDGQEGDCEAGPGEASEHEEGSGEEGTREASHRQEGDQARAGEASHRQEGDQARAGEAPRDQAPLVSTPNGVGRGPFGGPFSRQSSTMSLNSSPPAMATSPRMRASNAARCASVSGPSSSMPIVERHWLRWHSSAATFASIAASSTTST